ncbi:MAG: glutamine synthetase, type [Conexibacter sp.]|nr:glutamine synthetase, type [Conexibacter sp.]
MSSAWAAAPAVVVETKENRMTEVVLSSYSPVKSGWSEEFEQEAQALRQRLVEQGVKYCLSTWVDTHGRSKAKVTPIDNFDKMIRGIAPLYGVHAIDGMGDYGPADPDQSVRPDMDSVVVCPWDRTLAWFAGDMYWNGGVSYPVCARSALKRQIARARALGLEMLVGVEPEIYVYREDESGAIVPYSKIDRGPTWAYDVDVVLTAMPFLGRVTEALQELGWGADALVQEGGRSQYEFDFGYTDALGTADRWILLKEILKHAARAEDAFVTMMPKPFDDSFRSGLHFNMSLVDADGRNLMRSEDDPRGYGLSELAYQFIAGQLKHAPAITATACPTVNSYRGFVGSLPGIAGLSADMSWAPVAMAYGPNNRSAMLRLPQGRNCIENRATDPSCNIYLALAMTLGAALDGIENRLDPGEPTLQNLYEMSDEERLASDIAMLPQTLGDAVAQFDADPLSEQVLGRELKAAFLKLKLAEWADYTRHVSDWDRDRYLNFF